MENLHSNCAEECEEIVINTDNIKALKLQMPEDTDVSRLSALFKAIGDPTRIRIMFLLTKCDLCVCDIAEVLSMTQSAISHQLRLLRNLRLVKYKKEGKSVIYSLDDEHIELLFKQGMEHISHD